MMVKYGLQLNLINILNYKTCLVAGGSKKNKVK